MFDIANQLLTHHSHFAPLGFVNERRSLHYPQSKVICRNFLGLRQLKHWKSVSLTDSDNQASQEGEESQNTERKTESYSNSVALVMAFLAAENENRQLKDFPRADFDRIPERFLLSVGTNSITDNFVYWKLRP